MIEPFFKWVSDTQNTKSPDLITFEAVIDEYVDYVVSQLWDSSNFGYMQFVSFNSDSFKAKLDKSFHRWIENTSNSVTYRILPNEVAFLIINTVICGDLKNIRNRLVHPSSTSLCIDDSVRFELESGVATHTVYSYYMRQHALRLVTELLPEAKTVVLEDILKLLEDK